MHTALKVISEYRFRHTHNLVAEGGNAVLRSPTNKINSEGVYIFASPFIDNADMLDVHYVGSGSQHQRRLNQYVGIFGPKAGPKGRAISDKVLALWQANRQVQIFTRVSDKTVLFGHEVPLYLTEELALIRALAPSWNTSLTKSRR